MKPWTLLDETTVPGTSHPLRLYRREDEFSIRVGAVELMNSRQHGSEEDLADLACRARGGAADPQVLVGGLGMGFTVAAALKQLPVGARVTVAELVPAVVTWNRGPLGELAGFPLADPRVTVAEGDVADVLDKPGARFDVILLDVDNGPEGLTHPGNARLYDDRGLAAAARALEDGGVLAIWSVSPDAPFVRRLRRAGFSVAEHHVRARAGRGRSRRVVWVARRGRAPGPSPG